MVRSACLIACLSISSTALAQTTTVTQGPDGRAVTITQLPDGLNRVDIPAAQGAGVGGVVFQGGPQRDTTPATGSSTIRGRVVDASSGAPLRRATVNLSGAAIRELRGTSTDADGRYEFTDLPAGDFNLTVSKPGFTNLIYGQAAPNEMGKPLKVGDKQTLEKIDFALPHGAVITGRVFDEYGEPVPDVMVTAMRNQYTTAGPRPLNTGRGSSTNDIGEFRIFGLPPGQYFLSANYRAFGMGGPVASGDNSGYAVTYYPGTTNLAAAQKLAVGAGGAISDVTLILVPTRTARVSGVVVDSQGRPVRQGSVTLMPRNPALGFGGNGGPIRPDGTFNITGVAPGEYTLRGMIGMPAAGSPPEMAVANVTVNGVDITDVRLEPIHPITVTGHVVLDPVAARSFKGNTVRIGASPSDNVPLFGPPPMPTAVHDDLTFEFKANPGPSIVRATSASPEMSWLVKSITLNGADVTGGITFDADDVSGLEVELTNRVPDVSGLVTDGKGDGIPDYFAVAFPQDQARWPAPGPAGTAMVRPDPQGRFRFRSLRPGTYYVVAVDHLEPGQWMDPAFMEAVYKYAARITLNEGDVQTLDLRLVQMR